ncbi:MAG: AraC family transcriptional regulator [Elusimicrobia bacterium]|nr:AraC family transcriptional regulator [Elusimicrobiota bacterium]
MNKHSPVKKTVKDMYYFPFLVKDFPFFIVNAINPAVGAKYYHFHPFILEFHYIRSGNGYYFIKDKSYAFKNKSLLIIHGQDIHAYIKGENPSQITKTTLYFTNSLFKDYLSLQPFIKSILNCHENFPHHICLSEKEASDMELILHMLDKEWERKRDNYREVIKSLLITFLELIKRSMSNKKKNISSSEEHNPIIDEVLDYIDKHFKEHITLSDVSKHVGYSHHRVSHLFKKFTGLGFKEFIANRRVTEAKHILETDNNKKIIAISYEVGFSNLGVFNWNFKRLTDTTPSRYRKLYTSISR